MDSLRIPPPAAARQAAVVVLLFALSVAAGPSLPSGEVAAQERNGTNPLWDQDEVKNFLPHMTVPEVRDLLTRSDMVIFPVGALEQHGLHLP
ncbi:MAG: creatininase family protein, partial [Gemmatimonadetes bacterium]|nr:creatininase family protein [Gemmatimonadota bacterium]